MKLGVVSAVVLVSVVCFVNYADSSAARDWELDDGYVASVVYRETEENIHLRNKDGKLISTIDKLLKEGIQVEKPEDSNVCQVKMTNVSSKCYTTTPSVYPVPAAIADRCFGRSIVMLEASDCQKAQEDRPECITADGEGSRKRRSDPQPSKCCRYEEMSHSVRCVSDHCCLSFFTCIRRCCDKYIIDRSWRKHCMTGYERPFDTLVTVGK